jgi:hypothetical protein
VFFYKDKDNFKSYIVYYFCFEKIKKKKEKKKEENFKNRKLIILPSPFLFSLITCTKVLFLIF